MAADACSRSWLDLPPPCWREGFSACCWKERQLSSNQQATARLYMVPQFSSGGTRQFVLPRSMSTLWRLPVRLRLNKGFRKGVLRLAHKSSCVQELQSRK